MKLARCFAALLLGTACSDPSASDGGVRDDSGSALDARSEDARLDAAASRDAQVDATLPDAASPDAALPDAALPDANPVDAGPDCSGDPRPTCLGVCATSTPACSAAGWSCTGPGFEPVEASCNGFDDDCDGQIDEGVCASCRVAEANVRANLQSIWDLDFDYACRTYLTSYVSGPDFARVVSATAVAPVTTYFGNANQNMGFALVNPDPSRQRVVVTYSCCEACNCLGRNGLTLLYTCGPADPGCECAGQTNCPGFLDAPFLEAGVLDTAERYNGDIVTTPTGLAVSAGDRYFAGNFMPLTCSSTASCDPCDPQHPNVFCSPSRPNCCDSSPLGRLAEFTLPAPGIEPSWRVARILAGEEIFGLASGRDGSVWVGTRAGAGSGRLYRYVPSSNAFSTIADFAGTVFSITQDRRSGDVYLEVRGSPKIRRLSEAGAPLPLPANVPADPAADGVLQYGPDHRLYRLIGRGNVAAGLEVYDLP